MLARLSSCTIGVPSAYVGVILVIGGERDSSSPMMLVTMSIFRA